jgi:hypothetical protein
MDSATRAVVSPQMRISATKAVCGGVASAKMVDDAMAIKPGKTAMTNYQ